MRFIDIVHNADIFVLQRRRGFGFADETVLGRRVAGKVRRMYVCCRDRARDKRQCRASAHLPVENPAEPVRTGE
jgi:hypothetical protein